MTLNIIRVADLMAALKDKPQDARVTIMVYLETDGYHHEVYINEICYQPNFGPGKVILVGDY